MGKVGTRKVGTKVYIVSINESIEYYSKSQGPTSKVIERNYSISLEVFSTLKKAYEFAHAKTMVKEDFPKYDAVRYLIKQREKFQKLHRGIKWYRSGGFKGLLYESDDIAEPVTLDQLVSIYPKIIN